MEKKEYDVGIAYNSITFIPSSMKIGQLVQKLKCRTQIYGHKDRQACRQTKERDIQPYIQTTW
jgi:hypothetical protein